MDHTRTQHVNLLSLDLGHAYTMYAPPAAIKALGLLGADERAMLSVAWKLGGCTVLVDDRKGRNGADALGIPKIGTLGVILRARKEGHLPAIVPVLQNLLAEGLFISEASLQAAAASVSEVWP